MKGQLVGYARVSSMDQNLEIQLGKLTGCDRIFTEKASAAGGGGWSSRPQLLACLHHLREGDILMITRLDRLARSTLDLCNIAQKLHDKKVHLKVIDQNIDTSDATGRLLFNMLGAIAQFETEIRSERQREGIAKAQERGIKFGRVSKLTTAHIEDMRQKRKNGMLIKELMQEYGFSKASIYRLLNTEGKMTENILPPIHQGIISAYA